MNKEEEKQLFTRFVNILLPSGNYGFESRDKPDMEFVLPNKTVGVEITEILDQKRRSRQMLIKNIGDMVVSFLDQKLPEPFHLNLSFEAELVIKKSEVQSYSQRISDQIYSLIGPKPLNEAYHYDFEAVRTDGFIGFSILFSKSMTQSYFSESATGFIPDLTEEFFREILMKKEEALKGYHTYDEQWLVIAEGNFLAGSVDKMEINKDGVNSQFDRIFVFRQQTQEIIEIKTKHNN